MKLVKEILACPGFLLLISSIVIELLLLLFIQLNFETGYSLLFEPTKQIIIKNTNISVNKYNEVLSDGIYRYLADLKTIGRHMSTFVLEGESKSNSINKNSKFYKNYANSLNKNIIFADYENIVSTDYLKKYIINGKLNYISKFEIEFMAETSHHSPIKILLNNEKHKELNTISYYKYNGSVNSLTTSTRISANYLISILKTIFIKRFLVKRELMEYLHIFLILKDEIFIYPPDSVNNTFLYLFPNYANTTCSYGSNNVNREFPKCIYDYIKEESNKLISFRLPYNEVFFLQTDIRFNFIVINFCMTIPFIKYPDFKNHTYLPHLCIELNFTQLLEFANVPTKEKYKIGVFARYSTSRYGLLPVFYSNPKLYSLAIKVYADSKFGHFSINENYINQSFFSMFHFLYLDIFANESCYTHESFSMNEIFEEYDKINSEIENRTKNINVLNYKFPLIDYFEIEKTGCSKNIYNDNVTLSKDKYLVIIKPLTCKFGLLDQNFFEIQETVVDFPVLYTFAIVSTNPKGTENLIKSIIQIKLLRLFFFFFFATILLLILAIMILRIFTQNKFVSINKLIDLSENIEDFCLNSNLKMENINEVVDSLEQNSKEALILKNIFKNMFQTLLLKKIIEEKKIINLDEKIDDNKNCTIENLYEMIDNMSNTETKNVCKWIISHYYYKNGFYKLAEEELKSILVDISNKESDLYSKNDIYDSQLKDKIGRFNKMAFLNEFTPLKINEILLPVIKIKLIKQKVKYLYGLTKFSQGMINNNINNNNNLKNKTINNKNKNMINEKNNNFEKFYEAIDCFNECKDISKLLGMNPIKQIYSHIMIAQCYIKMKIYKEAMMNLHEALILYLEMQKTFKDEDSSFFCPRVMIYVESLIFETIMFNIVQAVKISGKDNACGWLILKIFETSPFIFPSIHSECSNMIQSCLRYPDKNNRFKERFKKIFNKISARLMTRKPKNKNSSNSNDNKTNVNSSSNYESTNPTSSLKGITSQIRSSSRSIDFTIKGISSFVTHKRENYYKNKSILLCLSEKIIPKLNGMEIKDVLIKFYQKSFFNNDTDKFGFIQFSNNGKKTITIKPQRLDGFLIKLESNKNAFQFSENYNYKKDEYFTEFYNLLDSIIKQQTTKCDYIIIMFINAEDIRFTSIKECVDIVNALNDNNYTVILLSNDKEISKEKIISINSFIYGLYDGHFIQVNNYQKIQQILIYFSTNNKKDKFSNYDFECLENIL